MLAFGVFASLRHTPCPNFGANPELLVVLIQLDEEWKFHLLMNANVPLA